MFLPKGDRKESPERKRETEDQERSLPLYPSALLASARPMERVPQAAMSLPCGSSSGLARFPNSSGLRVSSIGKEQAAVATGALQEKLGVARLGVDGHGRQGGKHGGGSGWGLGAGGVCSITEPAQHQVVTPVSCFWGASKQERKNMDREDSQRRSRTTVRKKQWGRRANLTLQVNSCSLKET